MEWFKYSFPKQVIASFPNGVFISGTPVQRARRWNILKSEGAMLGMPDLIICVASEKYHALFIEMKTSKGVLSLNQKQTHQLLKDAGYEVKVCRSLDEFIQSVNNYLES